MATIVLAQVTDTHLFDREDQPLVDGSGNQICVPAQTLRSILDHIAGRDPLPDLLLLTGDLAHKGHPAAYERLRDRLTELGIPYHWIPGNHDISANAVTSLGPFPPHISLGAWNLALLSSKKPVEGDDGEVSYPDLRQLDELLAKNPQHTLVAVHHHPVDVGAQWLDQKYPLRNADALRGILERHAHVKHVVFGHAHQEFDKTLGGIRYMCSPSTCDQLMPRSEKLQRHNVPPGYRILWLHDDGALETEVVRVARA